MEENVKRRGIEAPKVREQPCCGRPFLRSARLYYHISPSFVNPFFSFFSPFFSLPLLPPVRVFSANAIRLSLPSGPGGKAEEKSFFPLQTACFYDTISLTGKPNGRVGARPDEESPGTIEQDNG